MLTRRLYYHLKPTIPWGLRMSLRRFLARRLRRKCRDVWPILESAGRKPDGWPGWPDGKQFALVLTHDVEGAEGLRRVRSLAELEMEMGFRSCFNFIPEGDYSVPRELREWLVNNGFEVGVHDLYHDGKLFSSRGQFREHARRINHYLKEWNSGGFRAGFMLHNLEWQHDLNVRYDCSTFDTDPFEPQPDGVGTIFPFWVPHSKIGNQESETRNGDSKPGTRNLGGPGYVELPYTLVQDFNLFHILQEKSIDLWKTKLDWIVKHGGMALLNSHPDFMDFSDGLTPVGEYPVRYYREFLEYVRSTYPGAWTALPSQVADLIGTPSPSQVSRISPPQSRAGDNGPLAIRGLSGRSAVVVLYSYYPADPRPRRAAEALVEQGVAVELICLRQDAGEPRHEVVNGVEVTRVPIKRRRGGKFTYVLQYGIFIAMVGAMLAVRAFRKRYDLVHVHNMPDVLVFSAMVPKFRGARVLLDLHDPMPELMSTIFSLKATSMLVRLLKLLEKYSLRFADGAVTPNITFKSLFVSRSCPDAKMGIVMNSPQEAIFRNDVTPAPLSPGIEDSRPFRVLYHGSIVHRHGLDIAVKAISVLRSRGRNVSLEICGARTPYADSVMELARSLKIERRVSYIGPKDQRVIASLIAGCDLGVIPNRRSVFTEINMPTRIFENLAMHKPVIAPDTQGIRDYFSKESIFFFEPENAVNLAAVIEHVMDNPAEVKEVVARGRLVYQQHLWSLEKEHLVGLVASMLGEATDSARLGSPNADAVSSRQS